MRGMIIGGLVGVAVAVGLVFFLDIWDVWTTIGTLWSFLSGFVIGTVFVNLGMLIGGLLDDSY